MIFSRTAINTAIDKGVLIIDPFDKKSIGPAHIDLHLIDVPGGKLRIRPKEFIVTKTKEKITLSQDLCGFMEGRAGLAKRGISIEQSSTFIEPGSDSQMTLEIFNASEVEVELEAGQEIAKMFLVKVTDQL